MPVLHRPLEPLSQSLRLAAHALLGLTLVINPAFVQQAQATTIPLADQPIFSAVAVPGNLALALSVEFPTATTPSYKHTTPYSSSTTYLGYFDPNKCYLYFAASTNPETNSYFYANSAATSSRACSGSSEWSGNYMNWASMQSLDNFRWVLTGGNRVVDSETTTVLQKTYFGSQGTGYSPDKSLSSATTIADATPLSWSNLYTSIANRGTSMLFSQCAIAATPSSVTEYAGTVAACSGSGGSATKPVYRLYINVRVCDTTPDSANYHSCKQYGSAYKPEGLIQKYADKLRYSAFGYLNDDAGTRDGGVLRAAMTYVGPTQPVPGSTAITNPAPEWSGTTGQMIANPASSDASATATAAAAAGYAVDVPNSGVMNYLNKFGYFSGGKYKDKDPVSEMYYAVTRYFRNLGDVPEYSSLSGAGSTATMRAWVDGFPVIRTWTDPMLYSCQKNFILGIGDINTHRDSNLFGSTLDGSLEPALPSSVAADTAINVRTATNMVGQLEGAGSLADAFVSSRKDTYFVAGLAYHTHTNDIRTDLTGKQTINTYWMDVLETGFVSKNKYWLATKYGGFDVPAGFSPYASTNGTSTLTRATWNTDNDRVTGSTTEYRPNNYFTANDPAEMKSGLEAAFAKIANEAGEASSTSYATASPNVSSGNASYGSSYAPKFWTGDVDASSVNYASDGTLTRTSVWSASAKMDASSAASATWWSNTRKVATYCDASTPPGGIAFTSTDLAVCNTDTASVATRRLNYDTFANVSGVAAASQNAANYVAYLRGDRTQEIINSGAYRTRTSLLGDIVNSKLNAVASPAGPYSDTTNPGYSTFKSTYSGRTPVVYVGANDGMLHAFNGSLTATNAGQELFAYIPSFVYGTSTTGPDSGLASLGKSAFVHHNLVDGTARDFDIDFNRAGTPAAAATSDWRTILIGGLGKGGRGYYALDVTNPGDWTTEAAVASKVLWEFPRSSDSVTKARMGYTYGEPSVVKTKKYGWVAIFSSGYNNDDGIGYFFVVNPKTGALLETIATPEGSTDAPINMANQRAFIPDYADYTADAVYAGDVRGNVWRLDLTPTTGSYAAPVKIARLTNAAGDAQPITTRPMVETDPSSKKRYVLIGTGRLLADSDINSSSLQSFYAITDGTSTAGGFWAAPPSTSGAFPITRSDLNANTTLTTGIGSSPASAMGWYFDLSATTITSGGTTRTVAERVNVDPDANFGIVAFAANLPNGDACNPAGTGRVFAVRFATGKSVLTTSAGVLIGSAANTTGTVTDLLIQRVNGRIRLNVGDSSGAAGNVPGDLSSGLGMTRLNWREVPSQD